MTPQELLTKLREIRDEGPEYPDCGICYNIGGLAVRLQELLYRLFETWPEYSGDRYYPVEGAGWSYEQAKLLGTIWSNPRRHRLLAHCIATLEAELSQ